MTVKMSGLTTEKKKTSYFREVQQELKRVSWTSREELVLGTKMVIVATFLFSFAVYGVDLVIQGLLHGVGNLFQMVFG